MSDFVLMKSSLLYVAPKKAFTPILEKQEED